MCPRPTPVPGASALPTPVVQGQAVQAVSRAPTLQLRAFGESPACGRNPARASAIGLEERGAGARRAQGEPLARREGPARQRSRDPGLSEPADPEPGGNCAPLCGALLSAQADGPFHGHLPTLVPGWVLGFCGEAKASVGRRGDTRGAALFTHSSAGCRLPGILCLGAGGGGGGAALSHGARQPPSSPLLPPSLSLSLFPPSLLPPSFQQTVGCPSWYPATGDVLGAQGLCGNPLEFS